MQVRTVLGVSAILACIGGIMLLATLFGGINLVEYATQLAVGLTLVALGVAYWMFRPRIDRWTEITHNNRTPRIIEHWALFSHAKRNPDVRREVIHPIHHYNSRQELPSFSKMLSITGNSVDFVGLDFRIIIHQFMSVIRDLIYRNVRVTFLLLDPNSRYVDVQSKTLFAASDLKESIQKSLGLLCSEKHAKGNLNIRTYDYSPDHGIIIIDEGHQNAWIKIEERPVGSDSNSRPSDAWFRKYDEMKYNQYINEYNIIFRNSKEYPCSIS